MDDALTPVRARIPTLTKTAAVLGLFKPDHPTWKLREVVRELGWDAATTHRFLEALTEIGMLARVPSGLSYTIGILPLELSATYFGTSPARREVLTALERVVEASGLTTQVGVLHDGSVTIVASREGTSALNAAAMLGARLPVHATAAGKAILGQLSTAEISALVPEELVALTSNTRTTRTALLADIAEARSTGIAHASSELAEGLDAVAIPIGRACFAPYPAALTCAGPTRALVSDQWRRADELLRAAMNELTATPEKHRRIA